ncbi:MAG: hypothetical protein EOM19_03625 [Candidatus Moranbacteria bacterium]|nr:hypothetical protein [Candidatus Moranbacteria bacterium]
MSPNTVFFETLLISLSIFVIWVLFSIFTQFLAWFNNWDEGFFRGTWLGKGFGNASLFGYLIKYLTSRNIKRKRFIIPYNMFQDLGINPYGGKALLLSIFLGLMGSFILALLMAIIIEKKEVSSALLGIFSDTSLELSS